MATTAKTYLDLEGLKSYDALIKSWSNSANQLGYKTVLKSVDGNSIYFYKKPNAVLGTDTPDKTIDVNGGDIAKKLDELAAVAGATWNAETEKYTIDLDVTFTSAAKTVVNALNELKAQINTLNSGDTVEGSVAKKVKDAVDALDVNEFALATVSGGVVTIKGIKETDGKISAGTASANDVVLTKVATTGKAEDVIYNKTIGAVTVSDVKGALDTLVQASGEGVASKTVYITETPGESSSAYSKRYTFYQGSQGSISSPVVSEKLLDIDIPKDMVVEEGAVVDIVFKASDSTLHEGSESGPDVTVAIKGTGTATAADAGKYIKLVIANAVSDTIYIKAADLVDIYTGGENAETKVLISNSNEITVEAKAIDGAKIGYKSESSAGAGDAESVKAALTRLDGSASVENSVEYKINQSLGGLKTSTPVTLVSYSPAQTSGAATTITFITGISESDGVVEGEEDTVTLTTISDDELASLFS